MQALTALAASAAGLVTAVTALVRQLQHERGHVPPADPPAKAGP